MARLRLPPNEKVIVTATRSTAGLPSWATLSLRWIQTLDAAEKLDFNLVLGGTATYAWQTPLRALETIFQDLMDPTAAAYAQGDSLEQAQNPSPPP